MRANIAKSRVQSSEKLFGSNESERGSRKAFLRVNVALLRIAPRIALSLLRVKKAQSMIQRFFREAFFGLLRASQRSNLDF